jgi:hypothetical protein
MLHKEKSITSIIELNNDWPLGATPHSNVIGDRIFHNLVHGIPKGVIGN